MTPVTACRGRTLALFGLGGSGLASASALQAGGARVIAWDDVAAARDAATAAGIEVADLRRIDWSGVASLVLSPGVPLTHPEPHWAAQLARTAGVETVGDVELFCRERALVAPEAPFIAITGTNGKSTTTALTAHLFGTAGWDVEMGGNIGTPILALQPPSDGRVHVIEVSSYQIDLAPSLAPTIGMLLNVTPDHLDRHGSMENYAAVKERLCKHAKWSLVSVDDSYSAAVFERAVEQEAAAHAAGRSGGRQFPVSVGQPLPTGIVMEGSWVAARPYEGPEHSLADTAGVDALRGRHNAQNACFALGAGWLMGIGSPVLQRGLSSFAGLPHRMEEVGRKGGVLFINDSKATNADSTAKALACFEQVFWILGGKSKTGGIEALAPHFERIERAYLIGEAQAEFAATLRHRVPYKLCDTLDVAVRHAAADAAGTRGDQRVVLFSPACASFDQFRNFEERGDRFRTLVEALPG